MYLTGTQIALLFVGCAVVFVILNEILAVWNNFLFNKRMQKSQYARTMAFKGLVFEDRWKPSDALELNLQARGLLTWNGEVEEDASPQ